MKLSDWYAKNKQDFDVAIAAVLVLFSLWVLYPLLSANARYPFALFMDERISFEPINKAVNGSFTDVLAFLFDGKDMRYGRLLWNLNFIYAYLPAAIGGDIAQIVSTRVLQTLLLLSGYLLLLQSLIKPLWIRILGFLCLFLIPPSFYYFLMPKPEPEIIFVLGLFFYFYRHKNHKGAMIVCGILAGLKLSMLPFVLLAAWLIYRQEGQDNAGFRQRVFKDFRLLTDWKLLLLIALLLGPLSYLLDLHIREIYRDSLWVKLSAGNIGGISYYKIFIILNALTAATTVSWCLFNLLGLFAQGSKLFRTFLRLLAGFAICNPYVFFTPFNAGLYLTTPVTHGGDIESIGPADWIMHIYETLLFSDPVLTGLMGVLLVLITVLALTKYRTGFINLFQSAAFPLPAVFLITLLPVVLMTKRIWGFYLLLPAVLFLIIVFRYSDLFLRKYRLVSVVFLTLISGLYIFRSAPVFISSMNRTKMEQQSDSFKLRVKEYQRLCYEINLLTEANDSFSIFWDPNLFFPDEVKHADVKIFWGAFTKWDEGRSLIVLSGYPDKLYTEVKGARNSEQYKNAVNQYDMATDKRNGSYQEILKDSFAGCKLFLRKDLPAGNE